MFGYATVALVLFYLAYTVYSVPFTVLGMELTDDYDERAHIQKYRSIFNSLATFTLPWVYKMCLEVGSYSRELHTRDEIAWYQKPLTLFTEMAGDLSIKAEVLGSRYVAWGCALFIICAILPVSFFVKERIRKDGQGTIKLLASAKLVSKNKPFLLLCGMILLVITGNFFVNPLLMYLNIFYVTISLQQSLLSRIVPAQRMYGSGYNDDGFSSVVIYEWRRPNVFMHRFDDTAFGCRCHPVFDFTSLRMSLSNACSAISFRFEGILCESGTVNLCLHVLGVAVLC